MRLLAVVLATFSPVPVGFAVPPPYDVTGHWTGGIVTASRAFLVEGDLSAAGVRKFAGSVEIDGVPCLARGRRKKKVKLRLVCVDGTKGRLKGLLDVDSDTVVGAGRLKTSGRRARAEFVMTKIVVGPAVCGNGTVETGEQCDDGNTLPEDGCDGLCQREIPTPIELDEVEPNGSPAQATEVVSLPAIAHGSVAAGGDEDFYRIEVAGSDLVLETFDASGPGSCATGTDTIIELRGPSGSTVVAFDDDGGPGLCSRVELHGLTPGVYYPCVRSFSFAGVPAYQLRMIGP